MQKNTRTLKYLLPSGFHYDKTNMIKAALFDLDGVIIDTEPSYSVFWGNMGRKYNVPADNFAEIIKGTTLSQILDTYFDKAVHAEVIRQLEDYERKMPYVIFNGVIDFLRDLKRSGIKRAIVTSSNNDKMANLWLQHPYLKIYFDSIITDERVTHSKPHPEPYLVASADLGVDPTEACVFEDSFNGLLSARRAGAKVVALATSNPRGALEGYADLIIDSFKELTAYDLAYDL